MTKQPTSSNMSYKTDYQLAKLMNSLRELSIMEYSFENYGECVKRSIQWLRLYVIILPKYKEFISNKYEYISNIENELNKCKIFTSNYEYIKDKHACRFMDIISALSTDNYDMVLTKYMDCSKFLVGPTVYQLVQKVNSYLENSQQWDVFMTYNEMVEVDNGINLSEKRDKKLTECIRYLNKISKCPKEQLISYQMIIDKIRFRIQPIKSDNVLETEGFEHIEIAETDKSNEYDVVNTSQIYEFPEYVEVETPKWANIPPKEWNTIPTKAYNYISDFSNKRLTHENARLGQIVWYVTKKSTEYGKIVDIKPKYIEVERLIKQSNGVFVKHGKPICKASGNKPAFTRVITIL
jgi:hypothetical protein